MEQYWIKFYIRLLNGFYEQRTERFDAKNSDDAIKMVEKKYKNCGLEIVSVNKA